MGERVVTPKQSDAARARPTSAPVGRATGMSDLGSVPVAGGCQFDFASIPLTAPQIQRKPADGSPGDSSEEEADRIADDMLSGRHLWLRPAGPAASPGSAAGWPVAEDRIQDAEAALSGGQPLPDGLRARFEPVLGMDLGRVRVHHGPPAAQAAAALRARGFAYGPHVVFGAGQYAPGTGEGLRLLAHELAHVVQQGMAGAPRVDRANAADPRLPATLPEALSHATASAAAIGAALTSLAGSPDKRSQNVPLLVAQKALTIRPLTPRHDSTVATPLAPNPPINFFPGSADYSGSVVLPPDTTHHISPSRTHISIRARDHANIDHLLPAGDIEGRVVGAVSEVAHTMAPQRVGPSTTFDLYRARFNSLYRQAPFTALPELFDPTLSSRGPKTERSRRVFEAIHRENAAFAAAYDGNVGGLKEQVDRYQGPEGLNLLDSPGLQRLREVFFGFTVPVPAASFAAFRAVVTAAARPLTAEDRDEVDRSLDWQLLVDRHLTSNARRDEIKNIIRTATAAPPPPPAPPAVGAPPPVGGAVTPQSFVDSVTLGGPAAPVPAIARTQPVTLTPRSGQPNPAVIISSQTTVTPAASVAGANVSPASVWPPAAVAGTPFVPNIAVTGPIALDAQLALVNGPQGLVPSVPIPRFRFTIDDRRQANLGANWQPAIEFNDGARQSPFIVGSTPRYVGGAQTIGVRATMPVPPGTNPGLTLSIEARIDRGGAIVALPLRAAYPPNAAESALVPLILPAPAVMPFGGDPVDVVTRLLDATGALVSLRSVAMTILPDAVYPQVDAETAWNDDEAQLHDPAGFIGHLAAGVGAAPGLANMIDRPGHPGPIVIHPMVQRHDSAAYVTLENAGTPDPSEAAYLVATPPYAAHPDAPHTMVLPTGAGGFRVEAGGHPAYPGRFILLSRTPDVTLGVPRRSDAEVEIVAIHEATHFMDPTTGATPFEQYLVEFRAYWMDGRFGPPNLAVPVSPDHFRAEFDPREEPPGPKSPRAKAIFRLMYDDPKLYPFCKPNYDANTNRFREKVDSYLVPDGINLILSPQLEALRVRFTAGVGPSFAIFRAGVRAFFGVGPPPPGGVLSGPEQDFVTQSRAWRDQVDALAGATGAQKALLKTDMKIP